MPSHGSARLSENISFPIDPFLDGFLRLHGPTRKLPAPTAYLLTWFLPTRLLNRFKVALVVLKVLNLGKCCLFVQIVLNFIKLLNFINLQLL